MNPETRKYLASIGAKGGKKSKRKLTKKQARETANARWSKTNRLPLPEPVASTQPKDGVIQKTSELGEDKKE